MPSLHPRHCALPNRTQGGSIIPVYTTDGEHLFRQEPYFHYLFGVNKDEFWGALDMRNVSGTQWTLLIDQPRGTRENKPWPNTRTCVYQ